MNKKPEIMKSTIGDPPFDILLHNYRERMRWHHKVHSPLGSIVSYPYHITKFQMEREIHGDKNFAPMMVSGVSYWADWAMEYHGEQTVGAVDKETGMAFGIKEGNDWKPILFWPHGELFLLLDGKFVDWVVKYFLQLAQQKVPTAEKQSVHKLIDRFYNENYIASYEFYQQNQETIDDAPIIGGYEKNSGGKKFLKTYDALGQPSFVR